MPLHGFITGITRSRRHSDHHSSGCYTDWVIDRFEAVSAPDARPPLIVPLTATFKPGSIKPDEVLREFERFHARLCSLLIKNHDRPSKRPLLPFALAWRDDPRTRPDKYRSRPASHATFFSHPSVAPHVHGVLVIHPQLVDKFLSVADDLGATWRGIASFVGSSCDRPVRRNGTLQLELECGQRISDGLIAGAADGEIARAELDRWLGYSSKLASRWDAGDCDLFTVLPTAA
jgi:hypothetical protein